MGYFWSPYYEIAVVSGLILLGLSAPAHFRARNTGSILYICWAALGNLVFLINKLVWHDHLRNIAPVWCDITGKLEIGFSVAISAASLVINRRLYIISRVSSVFATPAQQRRDLIIELCIGVGLPVLVMILHYIVQGHRGDIIQGIGCHFTYVNTPAAFPLVIMWPLLLSAVSIVYSLLSFHAWLKRRNQLEEFLNSNASGLNADRYFRLMCFAALELVVSFPLTLWLTISITFSIPIVPWVSWESIHSMFDRFNQIPAIFIESNPTSHSQFAAHLWAVPFVSWIFVLFFGFGREQINQYKRWFYAILKPFGVKPPQPKPYSHDRRTWWQKLLRQRASTQYGTGVNSSRGATDSLPAFRHGAPQVGSYGEKQIPSARSKNVHVTLDTTMTFDLDQYDEKADTASDIVDSRHLHAAYGVGKALPTSPTVVDSLRESDADDKYSRKGTETSSASSVAGSSREVSETERHAIETRVQRMV